MKGDYMDIKSKLFITLCLSIAGLIIVYVLYNNSFIDNRIALCLNMLNTLALFIIMLKLKKEEK